MTPESAFAEVWRSALAFGWRDDQGTVRVSWGEEDAASGHRLDFRGFHECQSFKDPWRDFPPKGKMRLANFTEFSAPPEPTWTPLSFGNGADFPPKERWRDFCLEIEKALGTGRLKKAVPARSRIFSGVDAAAEARKQLLPRLFSGPPDGTYRFFVKRNESVFWGASPELLFREDDRGLFVPAIAGTRARPENQQLLSATERELLSDPKELEEHALVVEGIKEALCALGLKPESPEKPAILRLPQLIHLYTPVRARSAGLDPDMLTDALHPTPAVGGLPKREAQAFLLEKEGLERGLFASPLRFSWPEGEIGIVAIRSSLLTPTALHFFAGAGYVPGAQWEAEWRETERKMMSVLWVLGRDSR